jgi:hypothetical protein
MIITIEWIIINRWTEERGKLCKQRVLRCILAFQDSLHKGDHISPVMVTRMSPKEGQKMQEADETQF